MDKKRRRKLWGRHILTVGALLLLALCGYELWIRMEDFLAWTSGVRHLSSVRGTPFWEDMAIIFEEPKMRQLGLKMLFLLALAVFALVCLTQRNRRGGACVILALDVAMAAAAMHIGLYTFSMINWVQSVKIVPQALILIGAAANLIPERHKKPPAPPKPGKHPEESKRRIRP